MVRCSVASFALLFVSVVTADNDHDGLRRHRRSVLEVDGKDRAAQILDSLWDVDGIQPQYRQLGKKSSKSSKSSKKSSKKKKGMSMSYYYY